MKIAITGKDGYLGKAIIEYLQKDHFIVPLSSNITSIKNTITSRISGCDVFINVAYKDRAQSTIFENVYNHWKYKDKTIINILTSSLIFGGPNKKYIADKKHLENLSISLRNEDKKVRITNIYPNTLEHSKVFKYNKLKLEDIAKTIEYVISLPQEVEIFSLGISRTTLLNDKKKTLLI